VNLLAKFALEGTVRIGSPIIPRNRYLVVIAVVAFCLSLIEITDVVPLPFEGAIGGAFSRSLVSVASLVNLISTQGYPSLFFLMVAESASLPIPSEVVLPFTGYLVYLGSMNFALSLAVSTVAGLVGALIDFYIALMLGRPFVDALLGKFGVKKETIDSAERWMNRRGSWSVLVARFIPGLRQVISIPAGILKMGVKSFVAMTVLGSFVWSAALIYLGYSAGGLWDSAIASSSGTMNNLAVFAVAVVSGAYIAYYFYAGRSGRLKGASHLPTPQSQ